MPDYDFRQLSPHDFEVLCRDLLQAEWGVLLEGFRAGPDDGIDLRYSRAGGDTIIQCKRYVDTPFSGLLREITSEANKVRQLSPARYVLMTTAPLSPGNKDAIVGAIGAQYVRSNDIFGRNDLNNLLGRHQNVEAAHFKLWLASKAVLDRVLHNATVVHSEFAVEAVHQQIQRYVQTESYPIAIEAIERRHSVILSGPPGVGKSTLARMLLYKYLEDGYEPIVIRHDFQEALQLLNRGSKQIVYFDDFLGVTFLGDRSTFLGRNEDRSIVEFIAAVRSMPHARIVLTTREHILNQAVRISEQLRHSDVIDPKIVIEMGSYSRRQRGQILYNHIYFSDLPRNYVEALLVDDFYLEIVRHEKFNPRLVEWLSTFRRVREVDVGDYQHFVRRLLSEPSEIWRHAYEQQITHSGRSLMLALYSLGSRASRQELAEAFSVMHEVRSTKYHFERSAGDLRSGLAELSGAFIRLTGNELEVLDPSVTDMMNAVVRDSPENAIDLIAGAAAIQQVETAWRAFTSLCPATDIALFRRNAERLAESILPLACADRRSVHSDGSTHYDGMVLEDRVRLLLDIAERVRVRPFDTLVEAVVERLKREWREEWPNIRQCIRMLSDIDALEWEPIAKLQSLRDVATEVMVADVAGGCSSSDLLALTRVTDLCGDPGDYYERVLRDAAEGYLSTYFQDELNRCESKNHYEDLRDVIEQIGWIWSVDVTWRVRILEDIIDSEQSDDDDDIYHDHGPGRDDSRRRVGDPISRDGEHSEQHEVDNAVRDLFDTLRLGDD